jgi:PAS domain S-box-containing protein
MDFRAFEATPGISVIIEPGADVFTLVAVSNDFIRTYGVTRESVIGKGLFEVLHEKTGDIVANEALNIKDSFGQVIATRAQHEIPVQQFSISEKGGLSKARYQTIINSPILNEAGEVLYIIHTTIDITPQVNAEHTIESSRGIENAYKILKDAPVIIGFLTGTEYFIEFANKGLLSVWAKNDDVIGMRLLEAFPELERQGFITILDEVRRTGNSFYAYEYPITLNRYGKEEVLYFDFVYKPYYENGDQKEATGIISVGLDVTAQVLAAKKVQESDANYRTLFNSMDQGFCVIDIIFNDLNQAVDYRFIETNKVFETQTGLQNAVGKTALELVPNLETHWFDLYGKVALTGEPVRFIEGSAAMDSWFEVSAFPVRYDESQKVALLFTNISERKKSEEALRRSERNLRNIILQAPVAMAILKGPSFTVEIGNDRMFALLGRNKEKLLNKSIFEGLPEAKNQGYEELLSKVYTTGETFTAQGIPVTLPRNGDIKTVYIDVVYEPFREGDGSITGIMVLATDTTEQVLARMEVEESNQEFKFVTDFMPQIIWATKPDGYHEFYNKRWYDYTGLNHEESRDTGWTTIIHPDDQENTWKRWRHSIETGQPYEVEYRFKRYDGVYRWFLGRALPLKDEQGTILKWYGTCTDIDDQKKSTDLLEEKVIERTRELESQKKELERSNSHLEEFAYAASHDLKEPIRKIRTFSDRLKKRLQDRLSADDQHFFERMDRATERMQLLIDDLLAYSHVSSSDNYVEEISLNKKVAQVLEDLEVEIANKNAKIHVGALPVIKGHRRQMQQLFQNLITNALKFGKPGVSPEIHISSSNIAGADLKTAFPGRDIIADTYYKIEIADNGIGFEREYAEQIFKMFQRLHGKKEYEGTGIGLAIVRKVVENHQGFITAEGNPGEGAKFQIFLPIQ